uniref:MLO-like protein n=1 Tax=Haemonchus placei TaxID=6290 RepID=A0A0N4VUL3_HAEPC
LKYDDTFNIVCCSTSETYPEIEYVVYSVPWFFIVYGNLHIFGLTSLFRGDLQSSFSPCFEMDLDSLRNATQFATISAKTRKKGELEVDSGSCDAVNHSWCSPSSSSFP